ENFGPIAARVEKDNPWRGFDDSRSPVLVLARAQRTDSTPAECAATMKALLDLKVGEPWDGSSGISGKIAGWEPWTKDELSMITDCKKSPCDVKLDAEEGKAMGEADPSE